MKFKNRPAWMVKISLRCAVQQRGQLAKRAALRGRNIPAKLLQEAVRLLGGDQFYFSAEMKSRGLAVRPPPSIRLSHSVSQRSVSLPFSVGQRIEDRMLFRIASMRNFLLGKSDEIGRCRSFRASCSR